MNKNTFYFFCVVVLLHSCGSDKMPVKTPGTDTVANGAETQLQLGDVIGSVTALGNTFDTKQFDEALVSRGIVLDTTDVRRFGLVKKGYVFDMPESWTVFGMIPTETCVMLFYNYSNTACNKYTVATYNFEHGHTHVTDLDLETHMPPDGSLLPVHAGMNDELMISVEYRGGGKTARAEYDLQPEGKLERTFYQEYAEEQMDPNSIGTGD